MPKKQKKSSFTAALLVLVILLALACAAGIAILAQPRTEPETTPVPPHRITPIPTPTAVPTAAPTPTATPTPTPTPVPTPFFTDAITPTGETDPTQYDLKAKLYRGKEKLEAYLRGTPLYFGAPEAYSSLEGVITFRGNNFRNGGSYGHVKLEEKVLSVLWQNRIGAIDKWCGVGWNGQPVLVRWDEETKAAMDLLPEKKAKEGLIEVIYGTLDGKIYFLDAEDGTPTRDPIDLGFSIKGSVSIDPRGYPLLYVGQGIDKNGSRRNTMGWRIYSLIDRAELYVQPGFTDLAHRNWGAFDSVCLVNAAEDTVLLTGENGLQYSIRLNTRLGGEHGVSIDPEVTVRSYQTPLEGKLGSENSPAALGHYLFTADNSGLITCLDTTTLEPVWVRDGLDDIDASLVLDREADGGFSLYVTCQVDHQGKGGLCHMQKLDAMTGALLWEDTVPCQYDADVNGGGLATPLSGRGNMADLVLFCPAKVEGSHRGRLTAYDKATGAVVWDLPLSHYCWSSPTAVYTEAGKGYVCLADSSGRLMLIEGATGEVVTTLQLDGNVEGSPAVFDDILVVGTRARSIYGVKLG